MKLLFICTHNRCRSILAEAITNFFGKGIISARSAGSQPAGEVHPLTIKYLKERGIPTEGLSSESWDVHENWQPDVVITVCDNAAGESCPVWFGKSMKVHWGLSDPSSIEGDSIEVAKAFNKTIDILKNRIERLIELEIDDKDNDELSAIFDKVGKL